MAPRPKFVPGIGRPLNTDRRGRKNCGAYILKRVGDSTTTAGSSVDLLNGENTDPEAVFSRLFFAGIFHRVPANPPRHRNISRYLSRP